MLQEFKDFVNKGNVVDLAVAVVLGAAFAPVIAAVVDRVLMPIIGLLFGTPNFDTLGTFACEDLSAASEGLIITGTEACAGSIGAIITALINFLLVGLALFLVIKAYNKMQAPEEEAAPEGPSDDIVLLTEIRDELAKANAVQVAPARRTVRRPEA